MSVPILGGAVYRCNKCRMLRGVAAVSLSSPEGIVRTASGRIPSLLVPAGLAATALAQNIGPSTSVSPYILPSTAGVSTTSILTVNDPLVPDISGFRMVGSPDGMGAFRAPGQTDAFTVLLNHELAATAGVARAHGSTGSFVSRWTINNDLTVTSGRDFSQAAADINTWNGTGYTAGTTRFGRFCSADLAAPSAYRFGALGTDARIFMNGEEVGSEGRAFAHVASGSAMDQAWQLPRLGRFSRETSSASPFPQEKTIVIGTDDSSPGQLYMYVGNKTAAGNDIERAGLTNGDLFGVRVNGTPLESRGSVINTTFDAFNHGDVSNATGAALQAASVANNVTQFLRPEDAHWDPRPGHENDFYFVTTDALTTAGGRSRLYRMSFNDIANPEAGGTISTLLEGDEGQEMFDNITIDTHGRILLQEDPGNTSRLARIWLYDIDSTGYLEIAAHDPNYFTSGAPNFLTTNEESSGIIDAAGLLGDGWFLLDTMAHYSIAGELVEGGQMLAMYVDPSIVPEPSSLALLAIGGLIAGFRHR